eukprot:694058-Pleurochrysis_carterae.AAC.2
MERERPASMERERLASMERERLRLCVSLLGPVRMPTYACVCAARDAAAAVLLDRLHKSIEG